MPSPKRTRTSPAEDPSQLNDLTTSPPKMIFRRSARNARIYEWVMTNPTPRPHPHPHPHPSFPSPPHSNIQTSPAASASSKANITPFSMKHEAAAAAATQHGDVKERVRAVNDDHDNDDDIRSDSSRSFLQSIDCWNDLKSEGDDETHHDAVLMANSPGFSCLRALEDIFVLILCMVHWLTLMAMVCFLSGLVIVARTGYRLGARGDRV